MPALAFCTPWRATPDCCPHSHHRGRAVRIANVIPALSWAEVPAVAAGTASQPAQPWMGGHHTASSSAAAASLPNSSERLPPLPGSPKPSVCGLAPAPCVCNNSMLEPCACCCGRQRLHCRPVQQHTTLHCPCADDSGAPSIHQRKAPSAPLTIWCKLGC